MNSEDQIELNTKNLEKIDAINFALTEFNDEVQTLIDSDNQYHLLISKRINIIIRYISQLIMITKNQNEILRRVGIEQDKQIEENTEDDNEVKNEAYQKFAELMQDNITILNFPRRVLLAQAYRISMEDTSKLDLMEKAWNDRVIEILKQIIEIITFDGEHKLYLNYLINKEDDRLDNRVYYEDIVTKELQYKWNNFFGPLVSLYKSREYIDFLLSKKEELDFKLEIIKTEYEILSDEKNLDLLSVDDEDQLLRLKQMISLQILTRIGNINK